MPENIYSEFQQAVRSYGENDFLCVPSSSSSSYSDGAIRFTYNEASSHVDRLVSAYTQLGVQATDRVALSFENRLNTYFHLLALNALGASIVPLSAEASDADLAHQIGHSDSKLLVCLQDHHKRLSSILVDLPNCQLCTESDLQSSDGPIRVAPVLDHAEAAVLYTSGTTGTPKGCMLSNEFFVSVGRWYNNLGGLCTLSSNDRLLTPLPLNHMNALCTSFMAMMMCGGCVVQVDRFHPRSWWHTVREENANIIHCLGAMVAILMTLPEQKSDNLQGRLKFAFAPGTEPNHQANFEARFGFPAIDAWSMTETGAGGMCIAHEEPRHVGERCIGSPVETMEYRIVDKQDIDVDAGVAGELLVRTKGQYPRKFFFSGYYKDEIATNEGWQGGWWHTGDVVREGDDNLLYFVDRRKNVIRRSGENIAAIEVEATLLQLEFILNCAVCAVPDEIRGDEVFAFVVTDDAAVDRVDELLQHCRRELAYFKAPGYIAFVDDLPLTASQKISRGELKAQAARLVDDDECIDLRNRKRRHATQITKDVLGGS